MTDELLDTLPGGPARIEATTLRALLDIDDGEQVLARALADAGDDQRWRGRLLELRKGLVGTYRGRLEDAIELGAEALRIAVAEGDEELEMVASATLTTSSLQAGRPIAGLMEQALELAERLEPPRLGRWPAAVPGVPGDVGWAAGGGAAAVRGDAPRVLPVGASSSSVRTG